jgi:hypothetical protein
MPWLRWWVAGLLPWRPGFAPVIVRFMLDKVALGQVYLLDFGYLLSVLFYRGSYSYVIWWMRNNPVGCRSCEMSYPINIINSVMVERLTLLVCIQRPRVQISAMKPAVLPEVFRDFPHSFQANSGIRLKIGRDHFPSQPSEFIIHVSSFNLTLYSLSYWKSVVK